MTQATREMTLDAPRTGPWIIGYVIAFVAATAAARAGYVTGPQNAWPFWIAILGCTAMIVFTSWRRHRLLGTVSAAVRVFWRRMVLSAVFMFASYCALAYGQMVGNWSAMALATAATLPAVGFAGMVWAAHQYALDESDEYLKARAIRQLLIAGFVVLACGIAWSALAQAGVAPAGNIGMVVLLWFAGMGVGRIWNEQRP